MNFCCGPNPVMASSQDLAAAKPAMEEAVAALSSISSKDISTLKQLKKPPDIVKRIFDTVLVLKQQPLNKVEYEDNKGEQVVSSSYQTSINMMSDMGFLGTLMNFPKEQINDETIELLQVRPHRPPRCAPQSAGGKTLWTPKRVQMSGMHSERAPVNVTWLMTLAS